MKVSNCCGVHGFVEKFDGRLSGTNLYDSEAAGICPKCKEPCEYVCEECNGEGEVERNIRRGEEGMMIEMDVMIVCPTCLGKSKNL